ncbi:MAG: hypothetical protein NTY12_02970 [Candidatus Falkowbacteria bacterium]|nr:hypothetical protein [Candidatus Falkowbacteria bacterium]
MNTKNFPVSLAEYEDVEENVEALSMLFRKAEEEMKRKKEQLISSIKQAIKEQTIPAFTKVLQEKISEKMVIDFSAGENDTYLDYFSKVIFFALTNATMVIGYEKFICPGSKAENMNFHYYWGLILSPMMKYFNLSYEEIKPSDVNSDEGYSIRFFKTEG